MSRFATRYQQAAHERQPGDAGLAREIIYRRPGETTADSLRRGESIAARRSP